MKNKPLVSIIIPAYKSVKTLEYVLHSIKNQTYNNIEVIIVDRPTNDGTRDLVKKMSYIYIPLESERTRATNTGARASKGDLLYFVGSDYVLEPKVVEKAVEAIIKEKAEAVIIPNVIKPTGFWSKVRWLEKECYTNDELIEATRFISRKAFFDVGGYNKNMVAYEEHDLHNRLLKKNYKIVRVHGTKELNIGEPNSLLVYIKKFYYYGRTLGIYIKKYPTKSVKQLNPIRPAFIKNWKLFVMHPILTLGFIVYQFFRYLSAGLGYLTWKMNA